MLSSWGRGVHAPPLPPRSGRTGAAKTLHRTGPHAAEKAPQRPGGDADAGPACGSARSEPPACPRGRLASLSTWARGAGGSHPGRATGQERRGGATEKVPLSRWRRGRVGWALGSPLSVNNCAPRAHRLPAGIRPAGSGKVAGGAAHRRGRGAAGNPCPLYWSHTTPGPVEPGAREPERPCEGARRHFHRNQRPGSTGSARGLRAESYEGGEL